MFVNVNSTKRSQKFQTAPQRNQIFYPFALSAHAVPVVQNVLVEKRSHNSKFDDQSDFASFDEPVVVKFL